MRDSTNNDISDAQKAGAIAARYVPADPATWFDAAMAAGISQRIFAKDGGLQISLEPPADDRFFATDPGAEAFLLSWLMSTPRGLQALWMFMRRGQLNL